MLAKGGKRLDVRTLEAYLKENYGEVALTAERDVKDFTPLLQNDYGEVNDCTLVCITAILSQGKNVQATYDKVEEIATHYFYDGEDFGTMPIFIKSIMDKSSGKNSVSKMGKGLGFTWNDIKTQINKDNPVILSVVNDGRGYYKNHSITIIGYEEYNDGKIRLLRVFDNWYTTVAYVDFNKLPTVSTINYF